MARQFFSGNSIEQALMSAARHFGVEPERVSYKLREKKHGFIKTRRRIVIEVDPDAPVLEANPSDTEAQTTAVTIGESIAALKGLESKRKKRAGKKSEDARDEGGKPDDDQPTEATDVDAVGDDVTEEEKISDGAGDDVDHDDADDDGADEADHEGDDPEDEDPEDDVYDDDEYEDDYDDDDDYEDDDEGYEYDDGEDDEFFDEEFEDDEDEELAAFERASVRLVRFLKADIDVEVEATEDIFEVNFTGKDSDVLTADSGKVLEAIEHLLPRLVRGYLGYGLPCRVDCEGFRAARQQELLDLADDAADEVKEGGRDVLLEPMKPAERRVVHMALADDPEVETESEGSGFLKRVRVYPVD